MADKQARPSGSANKVGDHWSEALALLSNKIDRMDERIQSLEIAEHKRQQKQPK